MALINPLRLELRMSRRNVHAPKDVRAIEVRLEHNKALVIKRPSGVRTVHPRPFFLNNDSYVQNRSFRIAFLNCEKKLFVLLIAELYCLRYKKISFSYVM